MKHTCLRFEQNLSERIKKELRVFMAEVQRENREIVYTIRYHEYKK